MYFGTIFWSLALLKACSAERWRWPEEPAVKARGVKNTQRAESVRIDTKVRFFDEETNNNNHRDNNLQADEVPFKEATDTEGFYNRPAGSGRYPVRVEPQRAPYRDGQNAYPLNINSQHGPHHHSDGTLDSLQYCKCISTPECDPPTGLPNACGSGKFLCCYKRQNKHNPQKTEFFNEVEDERPNLLPGQGFLAGPFPPPPNTVIDGAFDPGHNHNGLLSATGGRQPGVLVGSEGPTGNIGPPKRPILVGPDGPTGIIGPNQHKPEVLVGPGGPTGIIGSAPGKNHNQQGPGILVGPGGPTGEIGPSASTQRGVLVGPGGPTGIVGPVGYNRGILVGPSGPTGIIGPDRPGYGQGIAGYGRQPGRPEILVGPGGPTGIIGPGRQILVGPGGPTGYIGPRRFDFGN